MGRLAEAFEDALEKDALAEHEAFGVHSLAREYRRMRLFMEHMPPAECFDAKNMLEVYDSWNKNGIGIDSYELDPR